MHEDSQPGWLGKGSSLLTGSGAEMNQAYRMAAVAAGVAPSLARVIGAKFSGRMSPRACTFDIVTG